MEGSWTTPSLSFVKMGVQDVYASVEEDNLESKTLFGSRGFERVEWSEMAKRYGRLRSLLMYREMTVVPGELLLGKRLDSALKRRPRFVRSSQRARAASSVAGLSCFFHIFG